MHHISEAVARGAEEGGIVTSLPKFANVSCGGAHTLAVTTEGALYAWGRDEGEG
jgi:hypothetical protein